MAAKKKAVKKKSAGKGSRGKCTLPRTCKYIEEWEKYWRTQILPGYIKMQRAICHLERVVLDGSAPNPLLRRCAGGGGGVEPPDPPPPPVW